MPLLTPLGVVIGIIVGSSFSIVQPPRDGWISPTVTILFGFMTFSGALSMNIRDFVSTIRKPRDIIIFFLGSHVLLPLLTYHAASLIFSAETDIPIGFLLLFSTPTAVTGYVWSSIYKGHEPLSLTLIVIDTLLAPFVVPLTISLISGASVSIDSASMMMSLLWMVALPSILGMTLNQVTHGRVSDTVVHVLKPFGKVALLIVICLNVSRIAPDILAMTWADLPIAIVACIAVAVTFIVGRLLSLAGVSGQKDRNVSMTFAIGLRNISAAMVLSISFFPPRSAIPVICGIIVQQSICAIMGKLLFPVRQSPARKDTAIVKDTARIT
ncbi:bile acid:sodium symporter family protein [Parasphaerochaeta coccoides]|uniref:Bile acid:sodium symporter n=1 Tax=Parasphaerochaeta coccoides (strain ATCC BAA-1237 / DSM 17374 / SPN1) TaxID=760011 RepID=F4GIZ6_PARC1|nr:bile acid:sodium symporter family protein [Parasphaerochaeta coccoides]AEC01291.1 Bile acid:sodium symporter [Parasphaerochaeta coccoides DSM 17374]